MLDGSDHDAVIQSSSPALRGGSSKSISRIRIRSRRLSSSSPALRGGSSKPRMTDKVMTTSGHSHHPLRCGAVLRRRSWRTSYDTSGSVIIPCVAGRFFEVDNLDGVTMFFLLCHHPLRCGAVLRSPDFQRIIPTQYTKSSSPALRGGSSKVRVATPRSSLPRAVIIPCVAGRFFEVIRPLLGSIYAGNDGHHPLRCGAVLRSPAVHRHSVRLGRCHHPLRCGAVLRRECRGQRRTRHLRRSSSPALRGGSSKRIPSATSLAVRSRHHPLRCGAVLRRHRSYHLRQRVGFGHHPLRCGAVLRRVCPGTVSLSSAGVIIPCVAGRFFEGPMGDIVAVDVVIVESSSPALRGGSSKGEPRTLVR